MPNRASSRKLFAACDTIRCFAAFKCAHLNCPLRLLPQLGGLVQLVRGQLSRMQRAVLSALIVIEVHAKDVVSKLVEQNVTGINAFEWISQLRFYLFLSPTLLPRPNTAALTCSLRRPDTTGPGRTCISAQSTQSFCTVTSTSATPAVWSSPRSLTGASSVRDTTFFSFLVARVTTSSLSQMLPDPYRSSPPEVRRSSSRSGWHGKDRDH